MEVQKVNTYSDEFTVAFSLSVPDAQSVPFKYLLRPSAVHTVKFWVIIFNHLRSRYDESLKKFLEEPIGSLKFNQAKEELDYVVDELCYFKELYACE